MRYLNRTVVVIKPLKPFVDWINDVSVGEDDIPVSLKDTEVDPSAYLLDQIETSADLEEQLRERWLDIFTAELSGWYEDEDAWPELTYKNFRLWFDFIVCSEVVDLSPSELEIEDEGVF